MDFKKELNDKQYLAVSTDSQFVRVVAGAGSGKTRVLTYRIAYLLEHMEVRPWEILAITFTNKVANEMKERVLKLAPKANKDLTIKTFHSFAAMFLRREIEVIGFPRTFSIIDEEDQLKLVKDLAAEAGYKKSDQIVKKTIGYIGKMKLLEKYPQDIYITKESFEDERQCHKLYTRYEEEKDKFLVLDFDDLLLKTIYILENFPEIRLRWASKYAHILVDEFQDTNNVEYKLLKLLMTRDTSFYVVGDPDQTIYTWRGANQSIILDLKDTFKLVDIVLDRNYRSTQTILDSANKLISHNRLRVKKNLYTENEKGAPITIKSCPTNRSEADYVCRTIKLLRDVEGRSLKDIVILYRSNYITQEFEQALTTSQIPYRIYGGTKFYQRKEIKDVLAYFRLINNIKDDISFERIINVPRRGIGDTTFNTLKTEAEDASLSLYEYVSQVNPEDSLAPKRALVSLKSMICRINNTRDSVAKNDEMFSKHLEDLIHDIGYFDYLLKEDDGEDRIDNVKALFEDVKHYIKNNPESTFDEYLQNIALISGQDEVTDGDFVTLMTIHTAKGLEFPVVFLVRLNEGVFPSARSVMESGYEGMEEERRLCYVAMTRAMERLFLTFSNDYSYVTAGKLLPSIFFKESGNSVPNPEERRMGGYTNNGFNQTINRNGHLFENRTREPYENRNKGPVTNGVERWSVGDICIHKVFGRGKVIKVEGDSIIKVAFPNEGIKTLVATHPALSKGGNDA